jgi:hypothetical protein
MNALMVKSGVVMGVLLAGFPQPPAAPPMKLGLWEITTTMTMVMPGMPAQPPRSVKVRNCVTAETWTKSFGRSQRASDCTVSHESVTPGHDSFDMSCPSMNATGHGEMDFSGGSTGHGRMHMDINSGGQHMITDTVWDSHFISADCGAVAPGKPEMLQ